MHSPIVGANINKTELISELLRTQLPINWPLDERDRVISLTELLLTDEPLSHGVILIYINAIAIAIGLGLGLGLGQIGDDTLYYSCDAMFFFDNPMLIHTTYKQGLT